MIRPYSFKIERTIRTVLCRTHPFQSPPEMGDLGGLECHGYSTIHTLIQQYQLKYQTKYAS
ncbi:hypothetical protein Glo7428_1796 [Gloeocapsa sp. PCC 7428]|nr:hypothetical protein Glo7428_1796 [Gloeocapsa sp. PCC 7428]